MQAAKDTFLRTMADRLAVVNPKRTVMVNGVARAAVIAVENECAVPEKFEPETFRLNWGAVGDVEGGRTLMYMDCKLSYGSAGTAAMMGTDRGRTVTAMDCELLKMCGQHSVPKCDYTQSVPAPLGTNVFWTRPVMEEVREVDGILQRTAMIRVFFFPEVG